MYHQNKMSDSENEVMEYLWQNNKGLTLNEICTYFSKKNDWKPQSIRVYLMRLKEKGYVKIYIDTDINKQVYVPKISKEEHFHNITQNIFSRFFNGSLYDFMSAFTGGKKLTEEEAKDLKKFLDE